MPQILHAAVDVAADIVRVIARHLRGRKGVPRHNTVTKPRRKPFDLRLNARRHIQRRTVRRVAVAPGRMLALRRARVVEERLLRQQHIRALRVPSLPRLPL